MHLIEPIQPPSLSFLPPTLSSEMSALRASMGAKAGQAPAASPRLGRQQARPAPAASSGRRGSRSRTPLSVQAVASQAGTAAPAPTGAAGFDFAAYVATTSKLVEGELDRSTPQMYPDRVFESMRYSLLGGGKRIRPMLCLAACELVGGAAATALPTAASLEMIHTMSLIHDDLPSMDNDDFRRGKPTNHKAFGEDVAILAGDAMLAHAFEHIARETHGVPAERVLRVIADVGKAVGACPGGTCFLQGENNIQNPALSKEREKAASSSISLQHASAPPSYRRHAPHGAASLKFAEVVG